MTESVRGLGSLMATGGETGGWKHKIPNLSILDIYAFLFALASWASIKVGGTLFGSDLMLILGLPAVLTTNHKVLAYKPVRRVLVFGALWLVSQMVTDLIRGTAPEDFERGWLKILFTLAHFAVIWVLVHNSQRRCVLYAIGLALGSTLRAITFKGEFFIVDPWKFGFAFPVSIVVLLFVAFLMRKRYSVYYLLPLVILAMVNVYEGFRSQAFVLMLTIVGTHGYKSLRASGRTLSKIKLTGLAITVVLAAVTVDKVYSYAAAHLWLGEGAYKKYAIQSSGRGGVLLGGRTEILSSSAAVADSPWIGHGSWPHDPKYLWIMVMRMRALGYYNRSYDSDAQLDSQTGTIPTHSHLMGAWVEAGIFGAVFWIYILYLMLRFLVTLTGDEPFLPFAMFQVILLIWDILFSPYGADRRFTVAYFLALLLAITYQKERRSAIEGESVGYYPEPAFAIPS